MATEVPRYDCHCCKPECAAAPTWELDPCGHILSIGSFDASVQDDIPLSAATMRWLGKTRALIRDGQAEQKTNAPGVASIPYRDSYTGVAAKDWLDPAAGCTPTQTIEGAATSYSLDELGASFNVSGPASLDYGSSTAGIAEINFSGTDFDGNPISYDENVPPEFPGIDPAEAVPVYSLLAEDLKVTQTRTRSWNYTEELIPDEIDTYTGTDAQDYAFESPFFRCKVTIPTHADIKFMEVEWMCQIKPDDSPAYDLSIRRFTWRDGDDREVQQIEEYTEFGEITLKGMRWRCTPVGHWQASPLDFAIEAWPETGIGINGNEGNDNGLYLVYNE